MTLPPIVWFYCVINKTWAKYWCNFSEQKSNPTITMNKGVICHIVPFLWKVFTSFSQMETWSGWQLEWPSYLAFTGQPKQSYLSASSKSGRQTETQQSGQTDLLSSWSTAQFQSPNSFLSIWNAERWCISNICALNASNRMKIFFLSTLQANWSKFNQLIYISCFNLRVFILTWMNQNNSPTDKPW